MVGVVPEAGLEAPYTRNKGISYSLMYLYGSDCGLDSLGDGGLTAFPLRFLKNDPILIASQES